MVPTVHVWTPTGALAPVGIRRYVAAFDENGRVSTGHARARCIAGHLHFPLSRR